MDEQAALLTARDFMNPKVVSLPAQMPIDEALASLERAKHSGAPVVEQDRVVGVLSELDCIRVLAAATFSAMPAGTVADHMTREVDTASPDDDIFKITDLFLETGHRRLPVVDASGALVGLIALRDLGRGLAQMRDAPHSKPDHPPGAAWDPAASASRDRRRH